MIVKIPHLASDYAIRFNLDPVLVVGVARYLREAGLLSQGGRGVNTPDATPLDAARLLIPFMVGGMSMKAKDAPQAVRDFGALVHSGTFCIDPETRRDVLQPDAPGPGATLEEAIANIITMLQSPEDKASLLDVEPIYAIYSGIFVQDTLLTAKIVNSDWTYRYVHPLWLASFHSGSNRSEDGMPLHSEPYRAAQRRYGSSIIAERQLDFGQLHQISQVLHGNHPIGSNTHPNDRTIGDQQ